MQKIIVIVTSILVLQATALCSSAEELKRMNKYPSLAHRDGNTLKLKLKSGEFSTLTDKPECDGYESCQTYLFEDYIKDEGFYLVYVGYYEGTDYLMVSERTGKAVSIYEMPKISPDRKRFVVISGDEAEYNVSGVFIWRFNNGSLVPEFSYEPKEYTLFSFLSWKNNSTIELSKFAYSDEKLCRGYRYMIIPAILKFEKGAWNLKESTSDFKCAQPME